MHEWTLPPRDLSNDPFSPLLSRSHALAASVMPSQRHAQSRATVLVPAIAGNTSHRVRADRHLTLVRSLAPFTESSERAPYHLREWREGAMPDGVVLNTAGAHHQRLSQPPAKNDAAPRSDGGPESLNIPLPRRAMQDQIEWLVRERAGFAMRQGGPVAGMGEWCEAHINAQP